MRWTFEPGTRSELGTRSWLLTEAGTERRAGLWVVRGDPLVQAPLDRLGPEATDLSAGELATTLRSHSKRLHGLMRDQRVIAGLGRMLTNEILYEAELSPFVNASTLDDDDIERLHGSIESVSAAALDNERTLDDIGKSADRPSKVHNRVGQPCLDCGDTIRSIDYRAYTVYYCPTRQTGGRILADNSTSKFLK